MARVLTSADIDAAGGDLTARRPDGLTSVVILGDSITEQLGYANQTARQMDVSYFAWANALMGGRFTLLNNAGRGSTQTTFDPASSPPGMGVRLAAEVLAYKPDWCWVLGGSNDINSTKYSDPAQQLAETKANLTRIIETCLTHGIRVLIGTVPPTASTNVNWTERRVALMFALNAWIRSLPSRYRSVVVADFANAMIDPLSTTAQPKTGMLQADDGIHPGHLGAYTMGMEIKRVLTPITTEVQWLPSNAYDIPNALFPTLKSQLHARPLLHVASGGSNGTGGTITGAVPGGFNLSKSGTWGVSYGVSSVAARPDGFGNDWVLNVTNTGASDDNLSMYTGGFLNDATPGDLLVAACEVSVSGLAQHKGVSFVLEGNDGSTTFRASALERAPSDNTEPLNANRFAQVDQKLTLVTGPFIVPPALTSLRCFLRPRWAGAGGTGTIKWGRIGVWRFAA